MKKIKDWFNKPTNGGICVALLVILMPYLSDNIKIGALIVAGVVLLEEIIRYILLGKPFIQISIMVLGLAFAIPLSIVFLIETNLIQYSNYKIYFEILTAIAFTLFYITLVVNGYKQHIGLRKFIVILHIIMFFLVCFVGVMAFIVKNN